MTRNPIARTRDLIRERWEASDWSRMTRRDIAWHAGGWALVLFAVVVVGGVYALAVATWPRAGAFLTFAAIYGGLWASLGHWYGTQGKASLRDQLDYAEKRWAMLANSEAREDLAQVGPITGPTPAVDCEPEEWVTNPPYLATEGAAS